MSEMAKAARAAMKEKAARMAGPGDDPKKSIDASGWKEPTNMNNGAQTGPRPVSPRAYKRGGKVHGEHPHHRADRKPRKSGGRAIVDDFVNRDVKEANRSKFGQPHVGGFAAGGAPNFRKQMHADAAEDKALIKHMVRKNALRPGKRDGGGKWIAGAISHPGALHKELHVPKGEKIPAKKLEKAEHSKNPTERKRANLAKTLGRMHKAAGGSIAEATGMRPKGDRDPRAHGGRTKKGKTNIQIHVNAGQPAQPMPPPTMPVRPPMPAPMPAGPPPQGMPPMGAGPMGPSMGAPMGGMPPQMARKAGGRVFDDASVSKAKRTRSTKDIATGAGGGLGRLAKTAVEERDYVRPR